ncbi:MAG: MBL fold metallo-hydrolase [Candidatus Nealsonbacteria bacterium]|nr:MBL fold metallo-hydrolase [Candidatus Nealsonbacteria bacterium]
MHIIWHGQSCFEIIASQQKGEQVKIVIDPFSEDIGLSLPKIDPEILLITHDHYDHSNIKGVASSPFLIKGPGEYEIKDIFVKGIPSYHDEKPASAEAVAGKEGKERVQNTIYAIEAEGIKLCHLGDFGQKELTSEQIEQIGDVDILMVPVGGTFTLDAKGAAKVVSQIEPRIVIPMHYYLPKLKIKIDGLEPFLKEMGQKSAEAQPKLLIKKKDFVAEETKVVVLQP